MTKKGKESYKANAHRVGRGHRPGEDCCGMPTALDRDQAIILLMEKHPEWSMARIRQRASVLMFLMLPRSV